MKTSDRDLTLLPVQDVMATMNISRAGVYRQVDAGHLKRVKIGARTFITRESLTRFLDRLVAESEQESKPTNGAANPKAVRCNVSDPITDDDMAEIYPEAGRRSTTADR
jgi:hypothetical protein